MHLCVCIRAKSMKMKDTHTNKHVHINSFLVFSLLLTAKSERERKTRAKEKERENRKKIQSGRKSDSLEMVGANFIISFNDLGYFKVHPVAPFLFIQLYHHTLTFHATQNVIIINHIRSKRNRFHKSKNLKQT